MTTSTMQEKKMLIVIASYTVVRSRWGVSKTRGV